MFLYQDLFICVAPRFQMTCVALECYDLHWPAHHSTIFTVSCCTGACHVHTRNARSILPPLDLHGRDRGLMMPLTALLGMCFG